MRISDWSSDVCSSDLPESRYPLSRPAAGRRHPRLWWGEDLQADRIYPHRLGDRKSVVWGKSVSVCVDLGGRLIIKQQHIYTISSFLTVSDPTTQTPIVSHKQHNSTHNPTTTIP